jgi:HD superfamily phosphodiesterase
MPDLNKVSQLVTATYEASSDDFAQWMLKNHVPIVAAKTEELARRFGADANIAVAGAWLHDFGDAFVHRHSDEHDEVSEREATKVLQQADYSEDEIKQVLEQVVAPHSCKDGFFPTTLEGRVMATADALAHLSTDFYIQFTWMHLPEGKNFQEYLEWVDEKLERDFNTKIFFDEVKDEVRPRYEALKEVFLG